MCPVGYYTMIKSKNHSFNLRIHLVRYAKEKGIRATQRAFQCSRNTVRKWLSRWTQQGTRGLDELSRAPKNRPGKTSVEQERKVIQQRNRTPGFGAARLKREFELTPGVGAIARIVRQNCKLRSKKKKHKTKKDLRAVKAKYAPLTRLQVDVKHLNDIPNYWPYMTFMKLPKFQYTTRCVRTGATFLTYANELSKLYAELTVRRCLKHFKSFGIDINQVIIQTDQGSEFDGQTVEKKDRGFTFTVEELFGAEHKLNRKGNPNANADVESFHSHEEPEFFDIESFASKEDFWQKITTYQTYWNLGRPNSYKQNKTPLEILREADPKIDPRVLLLPPIDLDTLFDQQVGHDVPVLAV